MPLVPAGQGLRLVRKCDFFIIIGLVRGTVDPLAHPSSPALENGVPTPAAQLTGGAWAKLVVPLPTYGWPQAPHWMLELSGLVFHWHEFHADLQERSPSCQGSPGAETRRLSNKHLPLCLADDGKSHPAGDSGLRAIALSPLNEVN